MKRTSLGKTGFEVSSVCAGAGPIGGWPENYGYGVDEDRALATVRAIFDGPINCLDTSRNYASGQSEERIGKIIRERGGLPDGFVLSTKVDREDETGRFDAARVRASFEESLTALGLDRVHILHLHDPEHGRDLGEVTAKGGAIDELFRIRDEGLADAVGLAMGRIDVMFPMVRAWPFDVILNHSRFTAMNRSASELYDYAHDRGIGIMNAGVYASGMLAKGSDSGALFTYREAGDAEIARVRRLEDLCREYGVAPGAAALQMSLRDARIATTAVGFSRPERVEQTVQWAAAEIPDAFWAAFDDLPYGMDDPQEVPE